jgi:serine/threonine protein kinase
MHTGQRVAAKEVKTLEPSEEKCLRELDSEYIIKVIDIFAHGSKSIIVLEFCDKNLREELKDCDFEIEKALRYFDELVQGMDVLQMRNIIHRDLKFENILVKNGQIKIADFGLAKFLGDEL